MKKLTLSLLLLFISSTHFFYAQIFELNSMHDILPYIDHETLVVFDIDDTVAEGSVVIATDQFFQHRIRKHMDAGAIDQQAVAEFLPIYSHLQMILPLKPVEECTPQLIRDLQQKGLKVIALTARSFPILERTIVQLQEINIDFSLSSLTQEIVDMQLKDRLLHKNGIIFCGQNDKGEALRKIFEYFNYYPKKIVFIDDKEKHLNCVQHVADQLNIPFIGIRYSCCDQKIKNFDCQEADRQLREFCFEHNIAYPVEY